MNIEELNSNFDYDHITGVITRKVDGFGRWKKGQICGSNNGEGIQK